MQAAADLFRLAIEVAPNPMLVVAAGGTVVLVNRAAEHLFGYKASELVGQSIELLVPFRLRELHSGLRAGFEGSPETRPMGTHRELVAVTREGSIIPVEIGLSPVQTGDGLMVVCAISDLTTIKRTEEDLSAMASRLGKRNDELLELVATDNLTSLKNRRAFLDQLASQLETSVRYARPLSVLILDIDHFKGYNDEFGHLAGDEVLKRFAQILKKVARRSDFVARLGGEEFGIILPETDTAGSKVIAERFREAVQWEEWPRRSVTTSVGAMTLEFLQAVPRPEAPSLSSILTEADRALYHSKAAGRNRVTHVSEMVEGE